MSMSDIDILDEDLENFIKGLNATNATTRANAKTKTTSAASGSARPPTLKRTAASMGMTSSASFASSIDQIDIHNIDSLDAFDALDALNTDAIAPVAVAPVAVAPPASLATPLTKAKQSRHVNTRPFDWRVTILTPQTFKTFIMIIYRVLSQCPFQLLKSDTFNGLRVDSMDSSMVCMIKASFECDIESNVDLSKESFAVITDTFSTLLKDVQANHILTLTRFTGSADLTLNSYAPDKENNRSTCTLSIIDEECAANKLRMQDITYTYMVEMDLAKLKNYCKMAQDINSSHMEFKIEEPVKTQSSPTQQQQDLFFTIGAYSDVATFHKVHHSTVRSENGNADVQFYINSIPSSSDVSEEETIEPLEEKYNEIFSTNYLNLVLKSMDRQTVQLYMAKSLPLVVRYNLGNDQSHIQIILAPRIRDEEEQQ